MFDPYKYVRPTPEKEKKVEEDSPSPWKPSKTDLDTMNRLDVDPAKPDAKEDLEDHKQMFSHGV